ncbi:MAG TPA: hypothetical protein VFN26_15405 [Candidatus Acidoferrum sp.]|nr:hypothetical protein [Candidatus Acidoferrum sp.]
MGTPMAYFGGKLPFAVFLLALFPGWTAFPQGASPSSKSEDSPAQSRAPSGVFLYTYRTPAHMQRSSQQVFQQAVDEVSRFLSSKNVPVRKVVHAAPSRYREPGVSEDYEDLSVGRDDLAPSLSLLAKARASGARYVLLLRVDRPATSWIKLKMQCFDLAGSLLWEAQSANVSALTGKSGFQHTLEGLEGRISSKTDELSRPLEETTVAAAGSTPASAPGQSEIVLPQPSLPEPEKKSSDAASGELTIEKGEAVSLLLLDTISSKDLKVADRIRFRVIDPVAIDNLVVVPGRAEAWGTVTAIQPARRRLKSAEVIITIQQLVLLNGKTAPLNAVWRIHAHLSPEHSSDVIQGVIQTYMLALPFVPFMHGDQVRIPKGTEFSAAFAERIRLNRAEMERLQPPTVAPPTGAATLTFYNIDENRAHAAIWCGKVKLGELLAGTRYTIELPAGTYWVRTESKKSAFPVVVESGGEYFIRISSAMTWGNPGYTQHIEAVKHDVGEVQVSDTTPLDSKHYHDFSKADPALLRAKPTE